MNFVRRTRFLYENIIQTRHLRNLPKHKTNGYTITGASTTREVLRASEIYSVMNNKKLSWDKKILFLLRGSKLCVILKKNCDNKILGIAIYYTNRYDRKNRTIHEGYIGVVKQLQGQGLGEAIRKYSIKHFSENGLSGISSRISSSNRRSLQGNLRLGFVIEETYWDSQESVTRHYLVKRFTSGDGTNEYFE